MKIIVIGTDNSVLAPGSALSARTVRYGRLTKRLDVLVPHADARAVSLAANVRAYGSGGGNKPVQWLRLGFLAARLLSRGRHDVISVQDPYFLALLAFLLSRIGGVGLEIQVHGFEKKRGLRLALARFLIRRADAVRTVSGRLRDMLKDEFRVPGEKITVVPIRLDLKGADTGRFSSGAAFVFLTVCRLVPVKNIGLQIAAMAEIVKDHPAAQLWIAGQGEETERKRLAGKIEKLGLAGKVKLLGWQGHAWVYGIYRQADCFLLTSWSEGWPVTVMEAAWFGLPIIMTDVGSAGELVINKKTGLVIPVNDAAALIAAMREIMKSPAAAAEMGRRARAALGKLPGEEESKRLYLSSWEKAASGRQKST